MRFVLCLFVLLVTGVLVNSNSGPAPSPWEGLKMPVTPEACLQSHGQWISALHVSTFHSVEQDKPAHCELIYPDQGNACKTAKTCSSHICIVHPVSAKGTCFGMLPPRGRFEFFDNEGKIKNARFPL